MNPEPHTRIVNGEEYEYQSCKMVRGDLKFYRYKAKDGRTAYFTSLPEPSSTTRGGFIHNATNIILNVHTIGRKLNLVP